MTVERDNVKIVNICILVCNLGNKFSDKCGKDKLSFQCSSVKAV